MGFLDNSGDIILDAVLTDAGRKRLAEGDGSFRITKYAFGDDEIDYGNYDASNLSGSAYYDLEILQTPILEAFTNNTANMKSKLVTLTNNNLLYLPVIILNQRDQAFYMNNDIGSGSFVVSVDQTTTLKLSGDGSSPFGYFISGDNPSLPICRTIRVDQGLNTVEISDAYKIDAELQENQYIVEIDNRFGSLTTANQYALGPNGGSPQPGSVTSYSFIDDDNVASYYLSTNQYVASTSPAPVNNVPEDDMNKVIAGPRGTHCAFRIRASTNLRTSTYLFERLGGTLLTGGNTFYYLDAIVRVTGATTGYKIDIPVRFVKCKICT